MVLKQNNIINFLLYTWVILLMTQFLRVEYKIFYFPLFIFFLILNIFIIFRNGFIFKANSYLNLHLWIFYILIFYICGMTFFYGNLNDFLRALPRMLIMPLTFVFLYNFISNKTQFDKILKIYIFFSVIAALSIFYQIFFGPLEFIVDHTERLGLERYASTAGSLTVFGGATGIFLVLTAFYVNNYYIKLIFFILFGVAGALSLSKSGLMNIFLGILILIFFTNFKNKFIFVFSLLIGTFLIYKFVPEIELYLDTAFKALDIWSEEHTSIRGQTSFRIFGAIHQLSIDSIFETFFGYGLLGGQGAFGLPMSIAGTTHNQFGDLFQIGGIFLFLNVLSIIICLMLELHKIRKNDFLANVFFYCNLIGIINMFFFNGYLYQPVTSFIFWLSLIYLIKRQEKILK